MVAGSQAAQRSENKLYVMKWCSLDKTLYDDQEELIRDDNPEDSVIYYEGVPHKGGVNRVRSMHGSSVVATWSDEGDVSIFDLKEAIARLDVKAQARSNVISKKKYASLVAKFKHTQEGYALDWSSKVEGLLASGSCNKNINLYRMNEGGIQMDDTPLREHSDSVEDL